MISGIFTEKAEFPIKVLQYGEGNFLRAFADYFIDVLNYKGFFSGSVAIVKNIEYGSLDALKRQNNNYTVFLESDGFTDSRVVRSVKSSIDMFSDYDAYIELAGLKTLKLIISNTTESGIAFNGKDCFSDKLGVTYPAKLTQFLYARYKRFSGKLKDRGLYILPAELIEDNADRLKEYVLRYIDLWGLEPSFRVWVEDCNYFCNTLVDRIVTGFPKDNADYYFDKMGYKDDMLAVAEPFGLWVIEKKGDIEKILDSGSLREIVFAESVSEYRLRKVRLLNAVHTCMTPFGFLNGCGTVAECMDDGITGGFIEKLTEELKVTVPLPKGELDSYSMEVANRFKNKRLNHRLLSISLNGLSKFRERVLPAILDYMKIEKKAPEFLCKSLAWLILMYYNGRVEDKCLRCENRGRVYHLYEDIDTLRFCERFGGEKIEGFAAALLSNERIFRTDLTKISPLYEIVLNELGRF